VLSYFEAVVGEELTFGFVEFGVKLGEGWGFLELFPVGKSTIFPVAGDLKDTWVGDFD